MPPCCVSQSGGIRRPSSAAMRPPRAAPRASAAAAAAAPLPLEPRLWTEQELADSDNAVARTWPRLVGLTAATMALCNVDRALLSVAVVPLSASLGLDAWQAGVLQSAYLWGYGAGQLPAGALADALGGPRVLIAGLALWSAATLALPLCGSLLAGGGGAPFWATPLAGLVAARVAFGLASSVALPATAASVALLVPSGRRASALSLIYAAFNVGSLVGLATTPHVIAAAGWPAAFRLWGAVGLAWAAAAWAALPAAARRRPPPAHAPVPPPPPPAKPWFARPPAGAGGGGVAAAAGSAAPAQPRAARLPRLAPGGGLPHLLALIWVHSVIGFGYFVLLAWTPTFFATAHAKAFGTLSAVGLVSALPWACSAAAGLVCGPAADAVAAALARRGAAGAAGGARGGAAAAGRGVRSPLFGLRCAAHAVATLLPALSLALLPVAPGPGAAVALLCCATGAQALNYAGFHAHVADVAGPAAGRVLALTNSGGIAAGIAGNLLAGGLLRATGSFAAVFGAAAALYLSSALVWALFVRGEPLFE